MASRWRASRSPAELLEGLRRNRGLDQAWRPLPSQTTDFPILAAPGSPRTESARLVADARSHQKDNVADMVGLLCSGQSYAPGLVARCGGGRGADLPQHHRDLSGAESALHEMQEYVRQGRMNYLVQFGEAARGDLTRR